MKLLLLCCFGLFLLSCGKGSKYPLTYLNSIPAPDNAYINGMAVDNSGTLWLCDTKNSIIYKIVDGVPHKIISKYGKGPGELINPRNPVSMNKQLFIADMNNSRISVYDLNGVFIETHLLPTRPFDFFPTDDGLLFSDMNGLLNQNFRIYHSDIYGKITSLLSITSKINDIDAVVMRTIIAGDNEHIFIAQENPSTIISICSYKNKKLTISKTITIANNFTYISPVSNLQERRLYFVSAITDIQVDAYNHLLFIAINGGVKPYLDKCKTTPQIIICDTNGTELGRFSDERFLASNFLSLLSIALDTRNRVM